MSDCKNVFAVLKMAIARFLFPKVGCAVCINEDAGEDGLCNDCRARLVPVKEPKCIKCGRHTEMPICPDCRAIAPMFTEAASPFAYEGFVKRLICSIKYGRALWRVSVLAYYMHSTWKERGWKIDFIMPVPMFEQKKKERGFNQTELIAEELSARSGIPVVKDNLFKKRATHSQAGLGRRERINNLLDVFELRDKAQVYNKNILLIDDVMTTGSTVAECSKILYLSGTKNIYVLTAASVSYKKKDNKKK